MTDTEKLRRILSRWSITLETPRPDIVITGSPERTAFRTVVEDIEGECWLLEKIPTHLKRSKLDIIHLLSHIDREGFEYALPYRATENGACQVANMLGCMGMENPDSLAGGMAQHSWMN